MTKELKPIRTNDLKTYYGSPLNQLIREEGRKDMTVINIDLAMYYYKENSFRIIESKRGYERLGKGQEIFLKRLSNEGIDVYCIYGDPPYNSARIYNFKDGVSIQVDKDNLLNFLNNKKTFAEIKDNL